MPVNICIYSVCVFFLFFFTDTSDVITSVDSVSPWWEKVREACALSTCAKAAYILALTARGVAMEMMINKNKAKVL